jgi:4-alpha-glucanotransferase
MGIPGYRVIPWERDEHHRQRHPSEFPSDSVATWSTHDTSPITQWWFELQEYERADLQRVLAVPGDADDEKRELYLLDQLFQAPSFLALVLAQELLGERARINLPASVGNHNWTYRLPASLESLASDPRIAERLARIRTSVERTSRLG